MQTPPKIMFQVLNGTGSLAEPGSQERLQNMLSNIRKNKLLEACELTGSYDPSDGPIYAICVPIPGIPRWQIAEILNGNCPNDITYYDFPCISEAFH